MFDDLISRMKLEDLAGSTAFKRGEVYFSVGAVGPLRATTNKIGARVEGTETYHVELRNDDGDLAYDCTCPRAADGTFCKHCVALGLAWLAENSGAEASSQQKQQPWRDIEAYLRMQAPEILIELLLDMAQRDERLYQSLLLKAERTGDSTNVGKAFRRAIDGATRLHGFIDWQEVGIFTSNLDQVIDSLEELLQPDTAALLVELAEYAIMQVENVLGEIDDSNGEVGDIICRLGELHVEACAMARPEPTDLADRLFRLETTLPFGLCRFDAYTYREALGQEGLRRYRERAEAEWHKLKPYDEKERYDTHRAKITQIMEQLAEASGDIDELVAIKSQDLSAAYRYLDIAEIWAKANQPDKALAWAEQGLKAFPERPDNRLRDFLVAAYLACKRNDEALQLTWIQFEERTILELYKKLHDVASLLGVWPTLREKALNRVADEILCKASTPSRWKSAPSLPNYSLRVEIALWEKDLEAAWASAHQGFCERNLLIALALELECSRPQDAVSLYRQVIPTIVEQTNNAAYEEAIKLIRKTGELMKRLKQAHLFGDYLAELRMQFKLKRNFIKLLDGVVRSTFP